MNPQQLHQRMMMGQAEQWVPRPMMPQMTQRISQPNSSVPQPQPQWIGRATTIPNSMYGEYFQSPPAKMPTNTPNPLLIQPMNSTSQMPSVLSLGGLTVNGATGGPNFDMTTDFPSLPSALATSRGNQSQSTANSSGPATIPNPLTNTSGQTLMNHPKSTLMGSTAVTIHPPQSHLKMKAPPNLDPSDSSEYPGLPSSIGTSQQQVHQYKMKLSQGNLPFGNENQSNNSQQNSGPPSLSGSNIIVNPQRSSSNRFVIGSPSKLSSSNNTSSSQQQQQQHHQQQQQHHHLLLHQQQQGNLVVGGAPSSSSLYGNDEDSVMNSMMNHLNFQSSNVSFPTFGSQPPISNPSSSLLSNGSSSGASFQRKSNTHLHPPPPPPPPPPQQSQQGIVGFPSSSSTATSSSSLSSSSMSSSSPNVTMTSSPAMTTTTSSSSISASSTFSSSNDKYGIMGMLQLISKSQEVGGNSNTESTNIVSRGTDLTTLGLNLNSSECLFNSFISPWYDGSTTKTSLNNFLYGKKEPEYYLPMCYYVPNVPSFPKMNLLSDESLFYIFYGFPKDILQLASAAELFKRDWRYHKELKIWLQRVPNVELLAKSNTSEKGSYFYFDITLWDKVKKDNFVVNYELLEMTPPPIPSFPIPPQPQQQPSSNVQSLGQQLPASA